MVRHRMSRSQQTAEKVISSLVQRASVQGNCLSYDALEAALPDDLASTDELEGILDGLDQAGVVLMDQEVLLEAQRFSTPNQIEKFLRLLTYREREIVKLLHGLGDGQSYTPEEVSRIFRIPRRRVLHMHAKAIRKLQVMYSSACSQFIEQAELERPRVEVREVVEQVAELSPYLMEHLKNHQGDLDKLRWQVFEQLVAECLASRGFEGVRLVGRDVHTSADIFAVELSKVTNTRIRYLVQTKRWKDKIGIDVVNAVYGAMVTERPTWGWHLAMIVSLLGCSKLRKFSRRQLCLMGIELRDRHDIVGWLRDYRPSDKGLWLPTPMTELKTGDVPYDSGAKSALLSRLLGTRGKGAQRSTFPRSQY